MKKAEDERREAWLAERRKGIGGSDAPIILGLSPWSSPLELWTRKLGLAEERVSTERMAWGLRLEPVVLEAFGEESGRAVERPEPYTAVWHPKVSYLFATMDGYQVDPKRGRGVVEVKTHEADWGDYGEPPVHELCQLQHQLEVAGLEWGTIVCLVRGHKLIWRDYQRDDGVVQGLLRHEADFWRAVVDREAPPTVTARDQQALRALYPVDSGEVIDLPAEFSELAVELETLKAREKEVADQIAQRENEVRRALGTAAAGRLPDGSGWTWRSHEKREVVLPATTVRTLRRTKVVK